LKRKRTILARKIPQKHRQSTRLRTKLGATKNPQGSINQPTELSSLGSEQYLQIEGQDNPEPDHEAETGCPGDEPINESGLPSIPSMSPQGDLLHDFELAQILANMKEYI